MSVETRVAELGAIYEIVEILANATDTELAEGAESLGGVRERLCHVRVGELIDQLRMAEEVTINLMAMGSAIDPATHAILAGAHERAERALKAAERHAGEVA